MIELPRLRLIFVTDTVTDKVHVIDEDSNTVLEPALSVGRTPRALAITRDQKKLFVSNEQPIPNGTITVFDISGAEPKDFRHIATIDNVTCPEGLALSPDGKRLYVATQCGGGQDPVFTIDTASNKVVGAIPGLAVGTAVIAGPDGQHLYVARGNYPCAMLTTQESFSPSSVVDMPSKESSSPLSVIELEERKIKTICLRTAVVQWQSAATKRLDISLSLTGQG